MIIEAILNFHIPRVGAALWAPIVTAAKPLERGPALPTKRLRNFGNTGFRNSIVKRELRPGAMIDNIHGADFYEIAVKIDDSRKKPGAGLLALIDADRTGRITLAVKTVRDPQPYFIAALKRPTAGVKHR